ncbi:MAG: hypothetical protein KF805_09000 [Phycisphaeraceae bacterium]|nr:hypothetical protein [Phycisphaeraceae bacterium]
MIAEDLTVEHLFQAFQHRLLREKDLSDRADVGKEHAIFRSERTGARYLVKRETGQSYDASLARTLDAAEAEEVSGIIWIAESFLPKHRAVIEYLIRASGGRQSYAAVSTGGATAKTWCGSIQDHGPLSPDSSRTKSDSEIWESIVSRLRALNGGFASARVSHPGTQKPWLRVDVVSGRSGLYVDAFQRRQMLGGVFFEGDRRHLDYGHFAASVAQIEQGLKLPAVIWSGQGHNKSTCNIVTPIDQSLASSDAGHFEDSVIQVLTRYHVILHTFLKP